MAKKTTYTNTQKLAILCAQSAEDKLAENIIILDLNKIEIAPSNMFVLCDCNSTTQVKSVTDNILNNVAEHNLAKPKVEGLENAEWVILDFFDVVVHIFLKEIRDYYKIEKLWADSTFFLVNEKAELIETKYTDFKIEFGNIDNED